MIILCTSWHALTPPKHRGLSVFAGLCLYSAQLNAVDLTKLGERLRLSNQDIKRLAFFAEGMLLIKEALKQTADLLDFVDRCDFAGGEGSFVAIYAPLWQGKPELKSQLLRVHQAEAFYGHLRRAKISITGRDLTKYTGLAPGPELGQVLADLKRAYRNGQWRSRDEGLKAVQGVIDRARPS